MALLRLYSILFDPTHWFGKVFRDLRHFYALALVAAFITNCLALTVSIFSLVVYDRVIPSQSEVSLYSLLVGVSLFLILDFMVRGIKTSLLDAANKEIDFKLNEIVFSKILARAGHQKMNDAEIASSVRDFDSFKEFLGAATLSTFVDIPFALIFIFVLFFIHPLASIVPATAIFALIFIGFLGYQRTKILAGSLNDMRRRRHSSLIEMLGVKDLVAGLDVSSFFRSRWSESVENQAEKSQASKEILNNATNSVQLITQFSQVIILSVGALLSINGQIGTGALVAMSILAMRALSPFSQVVHLLSKLESAILSYKVIDVILKYTNQVDFCRLTVDTIDPNHLLPSISMKGIYFQYQGQAKPTLLGVDFAIGGNQKLAILGKSGSGKTTLVRILAGLDSSIRGEVLYGGVKIDTMTPTVRAKLMSSCFQDPLLFAGTVLENICLDSKAHDTRRLMEVIKVCCLEEIVAQLKDGLNHEIRQRGSGLSGGEKQLIALARTLYRDVPLYVLDEPSSHLDPSTEQALVMNLKSFFRSKTVIFTSHKPKMLDLSTHCLVLDSGKVKFFGSSSTLIPSPSQPPLEQAA